MVRDIITMSQREQKRLHVVHRILDKGIKQKEGAGILKVSERQVRRIVKAVRERGAEGVVHGLCGRRSANAIKEREKERIKRIYKGKYDGFGPTLAVEKLEEKEKIKISKETLRRWLIEEGIWQAKRKRRKNRRWRERRACYGEMIQMDGSHHDWLEGRGPWLILMGYIDDANNKVYARFYEYEGTIPAMDSFKRYIKKYGIPSSVYLDNHSTYKSQAKARIEDELQGRDPMSEFERALEELGVDVIHAQSAPAKGRVERLFKTFQDRLVKELRLCKARTLDQANACLEEYLPKFNKKFSIEPREKGDLHRRVAKGLKLDEILCIRTRHPVRNDFTIVHNKQWYQVLDRTNAYEAIVQERVDGKMFIVANGKRLRYKAINQRPKKEAPKKVVKARKRYIPPADCKWRKFKLPGSLN